MLKISYICYCTKQQYFNDMKILLTGANGYIGKRLIPTLLKHGHEIICCVRDKDRFIYKDTNHPKLKIVEINFLEEVPLDAPKEFDIAYYLIHSMSAKIDEFDELEAIAAKNFLTYIESTKAHQIIYLSGLINSEKPLSKHLQSRYNVEKLLNSGHIPVTTLRAGIIVGSGSASFEIIRDLVEKMPVMITPQWVLTECQPIAIRDVVRYLIGVVDNEECMRKSFDIGGPEILTYKDMLLQYARVRKLKRRIWILKLITPRFSSYWLYFITSTSYKLAVNLVNSMKIDVVCSENNIRKIFDFKMISYKKAIELAFQRIEQQIVLSSWKDAFISSLTEDSLSDFVEVPSYGCYHNIQKVYFERPVADVRENLWSIGGDRGWYYANWAWKFRGAIDRIFGGVGLRRGRTNPDKINAGDALDFWRVIVADKERSKLLLFAEMKVPGEAWLEFRILKDNKGNYLRQKATFRPSGIGGRLYWFLLLPIHFFIFRHMAQQVTCYGCPDKNRRN